MNTLGAIPDITVFKGEWVPVSRNALTPGTRPLQLLPLPGTEFPVRHETCVMRGFQTESRHVGKSCMTQLFLRKHLRHAAVLVASRNCSMEEQFRDTTVRQGGNALNSYVAQLFVRMQCLEQLHGAAVEMRGAAARPVLADLPPMRLRSGIYWTPMRSRVVAVGFGDYAAGLRRTQPRFPPPMRYALMERWNNCTHTFIFGFGEMTRTPVDYTAITGLGFDGPAAPLNAQYQTATLGAELVRTLLGVTTQTRYTAQGRVSYEVVYRFWAERIRTRLATWRELPNKGDPAVLVCLRDLSRVGSYSWGSLALAHLYHGLDVWTRGRGESNWCGPTSTGFTLVVRGAMLQLMPGGFLGIWRTATIPSPVPRIPTTRGVILTIGPYLMLPCSCRGRGLYSVQIPATGYWLDRYFLGERIYELQAATAQRRVPHAPPRHMCLLEGMTPEDREDEYIGSPANIPLLAGNYATYFPTRLQARLPEVREYIQDRKKLRTPAYYRAQAEAEAEVEAEATAPAGPAGVVLGDVPFPPGMEVAFDPALGLGSAIIIPTDLRQTPPPLQLDPEHATHVPARRSQELYRRFGFARSYIARLYPELHERDLEAEAPVSPVQRCCPTLDGGGSASD
ncbi:hypothetical protein JCGZ_05248 [Jatropha curcas]|uniref:Aminotransferase-like plant mobile domain-containing protein n=1 Tax=Jatropha curcas TaxID=180498 RepID=A0A067J9S9_JATCU|nr:hypothetical protein JCGZ_05248 [Jatropha curcas]